MDELEPKESPKGIINSQLWQPDLSKLHSLETLKRSGIEITDDLIKLTSKDGLPAFPADQFYVANDEKGNRVVKTHKRVLDAWNAIIKPAINVGLLDEWQAAAFFFQPQGEIPDTPAIATTLASQYSSPEQIDEVWFRLDHAVHDLPGAAHVLNRHTSGAHFSKEHS